MNTLEVISPCKDTSDNAKVQIKERKGERYREEPTE